jgi:NADPH:quinone reductase-like Zn-dependent oxidoreductase
MQAAVQDRYGGAEAVSIETVEVPSIGANEVLVEVRAAGLDRGTEHLMTGRPYLVRLAGFGVMRPKQPVLGLDVAGTVIAVGSAVTRFVVGDDVFGIARGSVAEFAAAEESKLSHKPAGVGFEAAAVSAVSGSTALQALTDAGRVSAGQRVLVIGASGGVGTFAVQLARALGATVDGVAGTDNLELVRSLGADNVFDHRTVELSDIPERYDLVLDMGGRNAVRHLRRLLTDTGTLVIVGGEGGNRFTGGFGRQLRAAALSPFVRHRLVVLMSKEHHDGTDRLAEHLASGAVVPVIAGRFTLATVGEALVRLASGRTGGKVLVEVGADARTGEVDPH